MLPGQVLRFPDKYYASEVDKFAIQQTMSVFPGTIQLGDVTKVDVSQLDKIDLLIGGSPCLPVFICRKTGRHGYN
jgi:site-specific DNA-cytosine methylase